MKKTLLAAACAIVAFGSTSAMADEYIQNGQFQVRVRAVHLDSNNSDNTGLGLSINDRWIPEVDLSYYFTPNIAAELILTYPQKHDLRSSALGGKIGTLKHLPPTLTAQYHFTGLGQFKPYVGVGLNYTRFSNIRLPAGVSVKRNSVGGALQLGMDYAIDSNWSVNVDIKKVWIDTDVKVSGAKIGTFEVDPILFGIGVGYRF